MENNKNEACIIPFPLQNSILFVNIQRVCPHYRFRSEFIFVLILLASIEDNIKLNYKV